LRNSGNLFTLKKDLAKAVETDMKKELSAQILHAKSSLSFWYEGLE